MLGRAGFIPDIPEGLDEVPAAAPSRISPAQHPRILLSPSQAELNTTMSSAWISFVQFCSGHILNPSGQRFQSWKNPCALPGAGAGGDTISINNGSWAGLGCSASSLSLL